MDRILRQCLWRDQDGPKQSLAAWEMVCKPKGNGGLGIVNFDKTNEALLLKHLDKFYNKVDVPWVHLVWNAYYMEGVPHRQNLIGSFWWRDIFKLENKFREVAIISPGSGETILFWHDSWVFMGASQPMRTRFPRLFSFVLDDSSSVAEVYGE